MTGVSAQSGTALFVRKCLDGAQSPNAAQVLMAARGAFNETVFFLVSCRSVSGCQGKRVKPVCVCVCVCACVSVSHGRFLK